MGRDLEKLNHPCDCQRGEINHLQKKKEELEKIVGVNHDLKFFCHWLKEAERRRCRCGQTPSDVDRESERSYAEEGQSEYMALPMENSVPIPVPGQGNLSTTCPALEENLEEPKEPIAEDPDALLREANEARGNSRGGKKMFPNTL